MGDSGSISAGTPDEIGTVATNADGPVAFDEASSDRYVVIGPLGVGGRGTVLRAYDVKLQREAQAMPRRPDDANHPGQCPARTGTLCGGREYREAIEILESALGPDHPQVAMARDNLGMTLHLSKRDEESVEQHGKALAIRLAQLGPNHPVVAASRDNMAYALLVLGKLEESERQARACLVGSGVQAPLDLLGELEVLAEGADRQLVVVHPVTASAVGESSRARVGHDGEDLDAGLVDGGRDHRDEVEVLVLGQDRGAGHDAVHEVGMAAQRPVRPRRRPQLGDAGAGQDAAKVLPQQLEG